MKKHILLMAGLILACCSASAQYVTQSASYTNTFLTAMSPNGKFAAGSDPYNGSVSVMNFQAKQKKVYKVQDENTEFYELGTGANSVSDDGIVLISTTYDGTAAYIENGKIQYLPLPDGTTSALCNAITPDGSRIVGSLGITMSVDAEDVMQRPVMWVRQDDGSYSAPVELPYPKKDFTGRLPQYVLVDGISADGKTLACNIVDYAGMMYQPMIIKEDEQGEWSYMTFADEYINPDNLELPEYPGEAPDVLSFMSPEDIAAYQQALANANSLTQPMPRDFMTPENQAAYDEAANGYGYVNARDYMSDEEYAAYLEAIDQYYEALYPRPENYITGENREAYLRVYAEWEARFDAFDAVFKAIQAKGVEFEMNALAISPNGRYYTIAGATRDAETKEYTMKIYVFDLKEGKSVVKSAEGEDIIAPTYITDDCRILAARPASLMNNNAMAFVAAGFDADFQPLHELVEQCDQPLFDWMKGKMVHSMTVWDEELEEDVTQDVWITGTPCCDAEMRTIASWQLYTWGTSMTTYGYSYVMPMPEGFLSRIDAVCEGNSSEAVSVYDVNGRMVLSAKNAAEMEKAALPHGIYVVKTAKSVKKIVL